MKASKTPLLLAPCDKVDESAWSEVDNAVLQKSEVQQTVGKHCGTYHVYDDKLRQKMVKYAVMNGQSNASHYFTKNLGHSVTQSTIASMVKSYKTNLASNPNSQFVKEKRGCPTLLAEPIDKKGQLFVKDIGRAGGVVNSSIGLGAAIGICQQLQPSAQTVNGGWRDLESKTWARSLLSRMNFGKRKGTKTAKKVPDNLEDLRSAFLFLYKECNERAFNSSRVGYQLRRNSTSSCFYARVDHDDSWFNTVPLAALDDERQITGVLARSMAGNLLPSQLMYEGTTKRCHPKGT